jgi:hypothetical protein
VPGEVVAHIVAKTDGVPRCAGGFTKVLLASHLLQEDANSRIFYG